MPEKKTVTKKTTAPKAEKPAVKKTVAKTAAATSKPKAATTKATASKAKSPAVVKVEVAEVKASKVIEEPKVVVETPKPAPKPETKKVLKGKVLKITLEKSGIGYSKRHKRTLKALGFRHLHQTIEQVDTPSLRGMLALVSHLVRIEEQGTK